MTELFIYNSLQMGGVETFFIRICKERSRRGIDSRILFTQSKKSVNKELYEELCKYADCYFLENYSRMPRVIFDKVPNAFLLMHPINRKSIAHIFQGVNHIHVPSSIYALFYFRIARFLKINTKISIGVYHSREFTWKFNNKIPFFEKINREIFFDEKYSSNRVVFNEKLVSELFINHEILISPPQCFPLGVEICSLPKYNAKKKNINDKIIIGAVGRLVSFKTYNIWIIDVVEQLINAGLNIECHIYGEGELKSSMQNRIQEMNLTNSIFMHGNLPYKDFSETVENFDIFIGSGTAIIEASALGVPSIIGIENLNSPLTYGFFSGIRGFSYNEDGLHKKFPAFDVIKNFSLMSDVEKMELSKNHVLKSDYFSIERCVDNFLNSKFVETEDITINKYSSLFGRIFYTISITFFLTRNKIFKLNSLKIIYG